MRMWWLISIITIIVVLSVGFWLYQKYEASVLIATITDNYKPIGVIDLDYDHGINVDDIKTGEDVVLVIDKAYPNYGTMMSKSAQLGSKRFELGFDTAARDGLIDSQDPMWGFLYIVLFSNDGRSYVLKPLKMAGIHGIVLKHLTPEGNHTVLLTDGSMRTLYEYGKHIPLPADETSVQF